MGVHQPDCNQASLAHQNRTIAIASDFRVDGAKSPEIPQKEGVLGSEIAARNRKSLATFHRTLKSQCGIAFSCFGNRAISGVRDGHRNRKSQNSLRFRCAKQASMAVALPISPVYCIKVAPFLEPKGKDPHPQDKSQYLDFTKDPRLLYLEDPSLCILLQCSNSAKWWFSLRMIWGFWGPGFRTS